MTRRFDPKTNPYARDLLRLSMVPATRFSLHERHTFARVFVAKLYGLELTTRYVFFPAWRPMHTNKHGGRPIWIGVFFDSELQQGKIPAWFPRSPLTENLILLAVGADSVVEIFNGLWNNSTIEAVSSAVRQMDAKFSISDGQENNGIPARSDEEVQRDYYGDGEDRGSGRSGGGGDGDQTGGRGEGGGSGGSGGGGGGGDGVDGGSGAGGIGELLNHPVLFSVERDTYNAILAQT